MDFLRDLKANSSKWIHTEFPEISDFGWQTGYGAFTVSGTHIDHLKIYIAGQEEHHRRITFKEEYLQLLKEHGIEYDERYIWD